MDKLDAMKVFVEVAKRQSFTLAANTLGLSAPATTRAIASLEQRLAVKLFHRTTRHVRLTEPGARFLKDAKRIIDDLQEAEAAVTGIYAQPSGTLTVTAPVLFGERHVMPIIRDYLAQYPEVSIKAMLYDRVTSLLEEGLDIAIRIGHLKDSSLYAIQVGEVRKMVCASPDYLAKHGTPRQPSDLTEHQIIFPAAFESPNAWPFQHQGEKEWVKLTPRLHCNHNTSALQSAVLGLGITRLMSYQIGEELQNGTLQSILTDFEEAPLPVNIVYLESRRSNTKFQSFIELAVERLRANPFVNH